MSRRKYKGVEFWRSGIAENINAGRLWQVGFEVGVTGRCFGERTGEGYPTLKQARAAIDHREKDLAKGPTPLVSWLHGLSGISEVRPVVLTVGREVFQGAEYRATGVYTQGMDAVQRGDHKAGDTYAETRYYFLGPIPACRQRRQSICFTHNGRTLYLSSYMDANKLTPANKEYHPFGASFMLGIWSEQFGPIDAGSQFKYVRVPVKLESPSAQERIRS
jgi:hypothetical protein